MKNNDAGPIAAVSLGIYRLNHSKVARQPSLSQFPIPFLFLCIHPAPVDFRSKMTGRRAGTGWIEESANTAIIPLRLLESATMFDHYWSDRTSGHCRLDADRKAREIQKRKMKSPVKGRTNQTAGDGSVPSWRAQQTVGFCPWYTRRAAPVDTLHSRAVASDDADRFPGHHQ